MADFIYLRSVEKVFNRERIGFFEKFWKFFWFIPWYFSIVNLKFLKRPELFPACLKIVQRKCDDTLQRPCCLTPLLSRPQMILEKRGKEERRKGGRRKGGREERRKGGKEERRKGGKEERRKGGKEEGGKEERGKSSSLEIKQSNINSVNLHTAPPPFIYSMHPQCL